MLNFDKSESILLQTVGLSVKYLTLASALALNFVFGPVYHVRNKIIVFVCLRSRDTCYP